MTWLWIKKRPSGTILIPFTIIFTTYLHLTIAANDTTTTTTTTNTTLNATDGGGEGGSNTTSSDYELYLDLTNFVDGLNEWDFMGAWAKYDLSTLAEDVRPLPLVPDSDDQGVFICQTSTIPSTLQKAFPPLHNATFSLTYFAKTPDGELHMTGEVVGGEGETSTLFNYSVPGEATGHEEGSWGTDTFAVPELAAQGDFKIRIGVLHSDSGVWAAAEIKLEGVTGPPITITPAPPTLAPPSNVTTVEPKLNITETTTPKQVNGTTLAPNTTATPSTTTEAGGKEEEGLSRLESVAQAVWDAFYVFLALFCACLVALVALIVHGRCKNDEPPPAVATYNPRTASYRMDKVYDNPSYDNNSV